MHKLLSSLIKQWDDFTEAAAKNPSLAQVILGANFDSDNFAAQMVALGERRKAMAAEQRRAQAAQKAKAKR